MSIKKIQTETPVETTATYQEQPYTPKKKRKTFKKIILSLVVLMIVYYGYSWYKGYPLIQINKGSDSALYNYDQLSPEMQQAKDVQDRAIIKSVLSGMADVPKEEDFLLQEIVDAKKIQKEQLFFAEAKNGDKIVVFKAAKKAYLFRPSENRIVTSGPVIFQ